MAERPESAKKHEQIMARVRNEHIRFVNLEFTDVIGIAKSVTVPVEQFADSLTHGKWFDGSSLEGVARIVESDMYLFPDLSTFTVFPTEGGSLAAREFGSPLGSGERVESSVARVICNVRFPSGESFDGDPRGCLLRSLEVAHAMGYEFRVAPELEFFLVRMDGKVPIPLPHDQSGYFDLSTDVAVRIRHQMLLALQKMGIAIEGSHHEVAAGQHELDFALGDALSIADSLMTAKYLLKSIAAQHGLQATFLPKPFYGVNGSGLHVHQQLVDRATRKNVFVDEQGEYGLSEIGRYFIAGQLAHARAMCAILAPLVNSYKRLVKGFEAPMLVNWGRVNRQALIRVPHLRDAAASSLRVELRCGDPSCNPYLALAVMVRAGLDGIERKLPLPAAMDENLFLHDENEWLRSHPLLLPSTLQEALEELREDTLVREVLGDSIYEEFVDAKTAEWTEFCQQVHPWEIERYLPAF